MSDGKGNTKKHSLTVFHISCSGSMVLVLNIEFWKGLECCLHSSTIACVYLYLIFYKIFCYDGIHGHNIWVNYDKCAPDGQLEGI